MKFVLISAFFEFDKCHFIVSNLCFNEINSTGNKVKNKVLLIKSFFIVN